MLSTMLNPPEKVMCRHTLLWLTCKYSPILYKELERLPILYQGGGGARTSPPKIPRGNCTSLLKHTCEGSHELCQQYHGIDVNQITVHVHLPLLTWQPAEQPTFYLHLQFFPEQSSFVGHSIPFDFRLHFFDMSH